MKKGKEPPAKENDLMELPVLYIIRLKRRSSQRQKEIEVVTRQYEIYKTLNPRYFESVKSLKEVKVEINTSDIISSSKFNILTPY